MKVLMIALSALGLTACFPQTVPFEVQDLTLYGLQEQHLFFFGAGEQNAKREWKVGNRTVTISNAPSVGKLAVPGAWGVNGKPSFELKAEGFREVMTLSNLPFTNDLGLVTRDDLEAVVYFDGKTWYNVTGTVNADRKLRITPTVREGLRGLGQLNDPLADALTAYLAGKGRLAVALLERADTPYRLGTLEPLPNRYASTALYVQLGLETDLLGGFAEALPMELKVLGSGNGAYTGDQPLVRLDLNPAGLNETWRLVGGNQLPTPTPPTVNWRNSKVVTFFLGQRPTGGYGVAISDGRLEGKTLVLNANLREPGPGQILTQAFTSPYISLLVSNSNFTMVRVVNRATGKILAETKQP